jgi:uncharacterized protein
MDALPREIAEKIDEVRGLCAKYGVKRLTLFGSAVTGTFDPTRSDLDFIVEFEPHPDPSVRGQRWLDLWDDLKALFGRNIDLLVESTLKDRFVRQAVATDHVDLYAA